MTSYLSLGKSDKLIKEAQLDLEVGNLNKCVSASYFSARRAVEKLLERMHTNVPRRDDKLANALKHLGYIEEAVLMLYLYEMRKKADYTDYEVTIEEARKALEIAARIRKLVVLIMKQ
ncbi:HEPN domain-containing protein [Caldivirga sp. UBA161]|uniref:HEPN domain-containing protein n=1 Tax=Caldivirga sp. UBA161 TaxID=1915569 RepID=UPI0025BD07B3|nr:HEPN domain-containing protein [Caldivirga sp. UBA161]